jgi:hypothetical protein
MERAGGMTRSWHSSKELGEAFTAAKDLNEEKAARLEEAFQNGSSNVTSHLTLLGYTRSLQGQQASQMRLR